MTNCKRYYVNSFQQRHVMNFLYVINKDIRNYIKH